MGKYFLFWWRYAPASILDVAKKDQLAESRIIMDPAGL
jgi:hypothetical protein